MTDYVEWFKGRGITADTLETWDIGIDEDTEEIIIPYPHGTTKYRGGFMTGKRTFRQVGSVGLYYNDDPSKYKRAILCEGETDTLRLWQEYDSYFVCGIPGLNAWAPNMASIFNDMDEVYVCLDNDTAYKVRDTADETFRNIKRDIGPNKVKRIKLPEGVKDVCEFFILHNSSDFDTMLERSSEGSYHFKPLDLTLEPGPVDWLVEGLIAKGDVVMLLGEPNSGKSMIAQSIASAVVRQDEVLWQTYLVKPGTAKVIYVDEENPTDVVYRRLKSFGVQGYEDRIRYLFHQGVRLDRNADALYDEVAAFRPDLLVLDSLVRLHSKDENSSSDMAVLYNDAIKPIARELGTTVLLLHHSSKTDSTSSYKRGRGSGELTASPDVGLDIRVLGDNRFNLVTYKTRRAAKAGGTAFAIVEDNHGLRIKPDDYNPDF